MKRISTVEPKSQWLWLGWLSQTRPIPRSPDGDNNMNIKSFDHLTNFEIERIEELAVVGNAVLIVCSECSTDFGIEVE